MLGMSMGLHLRLEQKMLMLMTVKLDYYIKRYEDFWQKQPKHSATIPKELFLEHYERLETIIPEYGEKNVGFVADVLGGATLFCEAGDIRGVLTSIRDIIPFEMHDDGLHYTVALTPTHKLVHKVPQRIHPGAVDYEMATRAAIPGEQLDGNVGAILAPATLVSMHEGYERTICPFLFTDFEVEDKKMKRNFRRITSARQIGSLLGGQEGEEFFELAVGEHLGVYDNYREWIQDVAEKTPFKDLAELQEKYEGVDLKKYQ